MKIKQKDCLVHEGLYTTEKGDRCSACNMVLPLWENDSK